MQCLDILLTPESVQYGVGFFSTLRLFHGTVRTIHECTLNSMGELRTTHLYIRKQCKSALMHYKEDSVFSDSSRFMVT